MSTLPPLTVRSKAFGLEWELPSSGRMGALLTMRMTVVNLTSELRALRLSFSENDAFLFCGLKLFHFRLPPAFSQVLSFNLVPVKTGAAPLGASVSAPSRGRCQRQQLQTRLGSR